MIDVVSEVSPGLRERKKLRTRAVLVEAALELCLKQGYEQTTVEQIAASADVSPRTFSRYFPTKDAAFLTVLDDYAKEVAVELAAVPSDVGPLEAMRRAHVGVLMRIASRRGRLSTERIVLVLRILSASPTLKQASFEFRQQRTEVLLAKRMGVDFGDSRARLASAIYAATIVTACGGLASDAETARLDPVGMADRINEAFDQLATMSADLVDSPVVDDYESVRG